MNTEDTYWMAADIWCLGCKTSQEVELYYPDVVNWNIWQWIGFIGVLEYLEQGSLKYSK